MQMGLSPLSLSVLFMMWSVAAPAGTPERQVLTTTGNHKSELCFRDAERLVYVEEIGPRQWAMMQLTLSTGAVERLNPDFANNQFGPAFSPDGKWFAYLKNVGNLNLRLVIRNLETGSESEFGEGGFSGMQNPCFTPDSQRVLYSYPADGRQHLWSCDLQCEQRQIVMDSSGINNWPSCSRSGLLIFGSSRGGNFDIYSQPLSGGPLHQLTEAPLQEIRPRVTAEGTHVVFTSTRDGNYEIYTMLVDGTEQRRFTDNPERDDYPCWHPDGRIALVEERDGRFEIVLSAMP